MRAGLVGAFAGIVALASTADAQEATKHVVKKGDTCASIAQQYYGDARLVDVLHNANPELAAKPPPHDLKEGTVLLVPPKPGSDNGPDARLTTVRNKVDVLAPSIRPGKPKDPLYRGNRVSTEASSAADVTFRDESQVKLGERTLVVILGDVKSAAKKEETAVSTSLLTGNLRAFMSPRAAPLEVRTPSSKVNVVAGAEAQVSTDEKKTARLAVYQGTSTLAAAGVKRDVNQGFGAKAELGKAPTVPRPLPPAPTWSTLPLRVLVDRQGAGLGAPAIVGEYDLPPDPVTPAAEWHVQIARDGLFHDVIDTTVPLASKRLEVKAPRPGHYWLRVSAIDNDKFEGPYSDVARVLVVHPIVTPEDAGHRRIVLDPPSAACMRIGNVRLTWVRDPIVAANEEPVRLRCSSHEADPTTLIDIDHLEDFPNP